MDTSVHPSAVVDPRADLGTGVDIGPGAVIDGGVRIGAGCRIGPHAVIYSGVTLGRDCRVHAGAVLGDTPQDLSFKGAESYVDIGNDVTIREGVTIHRGTKEGSRTVVGDGCMLMAFSHLAHNVCLGQRVILANGVLLAGYVQVGDGAFLSGHVMVHQFVRIGRLAMMGGGSGISLDLPPFCTTQGICLNRVAALNVVGMRRAGIPPAERQSVRRVFKTLYTAGLNRRQALETLAQENLAGPAAELVDFVRSSTRGICGYTSGNSTNGAADPGT